MATANIYRGVVYVKPAPKLTPSRKAAIERAAQRRAAFLAEMVACEECGNSHPRGTYGKQASGHYVWKCADCIARKAMTPDQIWAERGGVKVCAKCGKVRRRVQFKRQRSNKDGAASECRQCRNQHDRLKRWANGSVPLAEFLARRTPADIAEGTWQRLEAANAVEAWSWWLDHAPAWWLEARNAVVEQKKKDLWRRMRRNRRLRERLAKVGRVTDRMLLIMRDAATHCHWCDVELTKPLAAGRLRPTDATIEHIVPLCDGGAHALENITAACSACNFSRPNKSDAA